MENMRRLTNPRDALIPGGTLFCKDLGQYSYSLAFPSLDVDCQLVSRWELAYLRPNVSDQVQDALYKSLREVCYLAAKSDYAEYFIVCENNVPVCFINLSLAGMNGLSRVYDVSPRDLQMEIMVDPGRSSDRDLYTRVIHTCREYFYSFRDVDRIFLKASDLSDAGSDDHLLTVDFARKTVTYFEHGYDRSFRDEIYELVRITDRKNRLKEKQELLMVDDLILGVAFNQGKESAFEVFYDKYEHRLKRFAFRLTGDYSAAQDIVMETFVKTWQRHTCFKNPKSVEAFLFTVTRNACLNFLRDQKKHPVLRKHGSLEEDMTEMGMIQSYNEMPLDELIILVDKEIELLPPTARTVVQLYKKGYANHQISRVLKMPENTVRSNKRRALDLIRKNVRNNIGVR